MKKILLLFCVVMLGVSCLPMDFNDDNWVWIARNRTEQTLLLKYPNGNYIDNTAWYDSYSLLPGDFISIGRRATRRGKEKMPFNNYFEKTTNLHGEDVYWQILSEDGITVLKTWKYSERDQPNQRFFNESFWSFEPNSEIMNEPAYTWIFDIKPEDIQPNKTNP